MAYIATVPESRASGELAAIYEVWRERLGVVPNIVRAVSLRPAKLAINERFRYSVAYEASGRVVARALVPNEPIAIRSDDASLTFRTWKLGEGQRYLLEVPCSVFENVYVFPAGAVTDDGPDRVIFLKSGDTFSKVRVEVLHQDHRVVVIPGDADIFPGNPIVTKGAFALGLALGASDAGDSAAGHGHAHGPGGGH